MKTYLKQNYKAEATLSYRCGVADLSCNGSASTTTITKKLRKD